MDDDIWMKFLKSGYMLTGYMPEVKDKGQEQCFKGERKMYERQVQRAFGTLEFGVGSSLKNTFVLISARGKT